VPGGALVARLEQRRLPHGPRLRLFGVDGQEEAISRGLDALLASQAEDGAFGSARATAEAALALLAEGDCSVQRTPRGRAVRGAVDRLFHDVDGGAAAAPILAALVEDYALGAAEMTDDRRLRYTRAIRTLLRSVDARDPMAGEACVLARMAGFDAPARDFGPADLLGAGNAHAVAALLDGDADRLTATVVLARGHAAPDRDRVRTWSASLFRRAIAEVDAGNATGLVLLTLQAPYRL
jgi:hypothetical protein